MKFDFDFVGARLDNRAYGKLADLGAYIAPPAEARQPQHSPAQTATDAKSEACHPAAFSAASIMGSSLEACTCCSSHRCSECTQASPSNSATEHDRVEVSRAKIRALIGLHPLLWGL